MGIKFHWQKYTLKFRFQAGTSRGILTSHDVHYVFLSEPDNPEIIGVGEASPLKGLSPDYGEKLLTALHEISIGEIGIETEWLKNTESIPSLHFALETAFADLRNGGKREIEKNGFYKGTERLPINGLVWMGSPADMLKQAKEKANTGYTTLKLKVGALDFEEELGLIKKVRRELGKDTTIRLDANGGFSAQTALNKLKRLSEYDIHSIEQPVEARQVEEMARLCAQSPIPIALDEELIGVYNRYEKEKLLAIIKPVYLILKPTLLGGFAQTKEWIELAEHTNTGWWITSALESNIGLNAISQFTANYLPKLPQGLGTGNLYENNIRSPLKVEKGFIRYEPNIEWGRLFTSG